MQSRNASFFSSGIQKQPECSELAPLEWMRKQHIIRVRSRVMSTKWKVPLPVFTPRVNFINDKFWHLEYQGKPTSPSCFSACSSTYWCVSNYSFEKEKVYFFLSIDGTECNLQQKRARQVFSVFQFYKKLHFDCMQNFTYILQKIGIYYPQCVTFITPKSAFVLNKINRTTM